VLLVSTLGRGIELTDDALAERYVSTHPPALLPELSRDYLSVLRMLCQDIHPRGGGMRRRL